MTERTPPPLTLEEAAGRLGVHYMTVYRYIRVGQLPARQENGRWLIDARAVEAFAARPQRRAAQERNVRWRELRRRLLSRLDDGDVGGAWAVVEGAVRAGRPSLDLYVQLLGPVLQQVGQEWASGTRSIEAEHRATSTAMRLAGRIGPQGLRAGRRRRATVLLGGAPGDPHQLPLLMVADALRWDGFRVIDLGANVPIGSFVDAATAAPDLVAVGVSLSVQRHGGAVAGVLEELRHAVPGTTLLAGGPALHDEAAARGLGADGWAPHAGVVAEMIRAAP